MTKPLLKGVLKTWKEDRGFGFITPDNGGRDVFIHISAIGTVSRRPIPGDIIHYQVTKDRHGKFRAINASIQNIKSTDKLSIVNQKKRFSFIWITGVVVCLLLIIAVAAYIYYRSEGFTGNLF